jgi:hypothetical protein
MEKIKVLALLMCLFCAISCQKMPTKTPAVQSVERIEMKDLLEFRKTPEFKNISAVMVEVGYADLNPEIILFAIGDEKLISQLKLKNYSGRTIHDPQMMNQLIHFKCNNDAYSDIYGASLLYVIVNDAGKAVLYVVPFGQDGKYFCGNNWASAELPNIISAIKKKYKLTWEE